MSILDVDTHEIDEKSIITYISSMYDVFPEPPFAHPLYDNVSNRLYFIIVVYNIHYYSLKLFLIFLGSSGSHK